MILSGVSGIYTRSKFLLEVGGCIMEAIIFAFFAFACFCIAFIVLKDKPMFCAILGIATSVCSGISMYLFWRMLEESGRDASYIGPWGHPIIPVVYTIFILLGFLFLILGFVKWHRLKNNNPKRT